MGNDYITLHIRKTSYEILNPPLRYVSINERRKYKKQCLLTTWKNSIHRELIYQIFHISPRIDLISSFTPKSNYLKWLKIGVTIVSHEEFHNLATSAVIGIIKKAKEYDFDLRDLHEKYLVHEIRCYYINYFTEFENKVNKLKQCDLVE